MASESGSSECSDSPVSKSNRNQTHYTLKFIAIRKEVGIIIGKGGANVKKIRRESGARVTISDGSPLERVVMVSGTSAELQTAFRLIAFKLEEDLSNNRSANGGPLTFKLVVSDAHCGSLIGKSGSNIKEMRELTGASIYVNNEMLPNSTERCVTVSGDIDSILNAIDRICVTTAQLRSKVPQIPYQPGQHAGYSANQSLGYNTSDGLLDDMYSRSFYDHSSYRNYKGNMLDRNQLPMISGLSALYNGLLNPHLLKPGILGNPPSTVLTVPSAPKTITKDIMISSDSVGALIGRHGSRINDIRQCTGANVKVADADEGSSRTKVTIIGGAPSVRSASFIIKNICSKPKTRSNAD